MEVPNKWRGVTLGTGDYVTGVINIFSPNKMVITDESGRDYRVDAEKVFKLAGYDMNGEEVYRSWKNGSANKI